MDEEQRRALDGEPITREQFERLTGYRFTPRRRVQAELAAVWALLLLYTAFAIWIIW